MVDVLETNDVQLTAGDTAIALHNAAVHDEVMTRADAEAARAEAVGILGKM